MRIYPTEYVEQAAVISWALHQQAWRPELKLLNCSLSGVRLTDGQRVKAKKSGMVAGYPDLFLPVRRKGFGGLFIEMKRECGTKSDVKDEQLEWLEDLRLQGFFCAVGWGAENAITTIDWYLL